MRSYEFGALTGFQRKQHTFFVSYLGLSEDLGGLLEGVNLAIGGNSFKNYTDKLHIKGTFKSRKWRGTGNATSYE
jgi:hypothetical protein